MPADAAYDGGFNWRGGMRQNAHCVHSTLIQDFLVVLGLAGGGKAFLMAPLSHSSRTMVAAAVNRRYDASDGRKMSVARPRALVAFTRIFLQNQCILVKC